MAYRSQLGLARMQILPILPREGHIRRAPPMSVNPENPVPAGNLVRVDAFLLERYLVLLIVVRGRGRRDVPNEEGHSVFGQVLAAMPIVFGSVIWNGILTKH
jgi:hypothetical protein